MKKAFITGINGQDGAFLADYLLKNDYLVFGGCRNPDTDHWRLKHLGVQDKITLVQYDLENLDSIRNSIQTIQADEVYNFASQSSVRLSLESPLQTGIANTQSVIHLLESIRVFTPGALFFQAGSSEMFGGPQSVPQTETTPMEPKNPYSSSKCFAYHLTKNYRDIYQIHAVNGILYNHESELRGLEFFTRKVSSHIASYSLQKKEILKVGNISIIKDIGYAPDFVEGMYHALHRNLPDDYIFSTGKGIPIKEFIDLGFKAIQVDLEWVGLDNNQKAYDKKTGELLVETDPKFYRIQESNHQIGDPSKARNLLGWSAKTNLETIVQRMIESDIDRLKRLNN
ncbi:MAG: GDP-mannose 4,6-dehydratase [Leptospiraceae bacterium]|nr:GDP-mannose 4,6-dehydratase [Leptospiraceae bacterium]MCP5512330.1 GDP-mannose 4,6-dehydratase [Leptospiraceae bacterium]